MQPHGYVPRRESESGETLIAACSCGWLGTSAAQPDASPDSGFEEWSRDHLAVFFEKGGVRGIVARDAIMRSVDAFARPDVVRWNSFNSRKMTVAWGWWATVNRTARCVVVLTDLQQAREAVPLVRVVFEHAIYLLALTRQGETAVDAAYREHIRQYRNMIETMRHNPHLHAPAEEVEIPDPVPDAAWTQQVVHICEHFGATGTLYFLYRTFSNLTHPSAGAAQGFLETPDEVTLGLLKEPKFEMDSDLLFWTAVFVVWAGRALNTLLAEPLMLDELAQSERELGIVPIDWLSTASDFGVMDMPSERLDNLLFGQREPHN